MVSGLRIPKASRPGRRRRLSEANTTELRSRLLVSIPRESSEAMLNSSVPNHLGQMNSGRVDWIRRAIDSTGSCLAPGRPDQKHPSSKPRPGAVFQGECVSTPSGSGPRPRFGKRPVMATDGRFRGDGVTAHQSSPSGTGRLTPHRSPEVIRCKPSTWTMKGKAQPQASTRSQRSIESTLLSHETEFRVHG